MKTELGAFRLERSTLEAVEVIKHWNSLPGEVMNSPSLRAHKSSPSVSC